MVLLAANLNLREQKSRPNTMNTALNFSYEFFPPRTEQAEQNLNQAVQQLKSLKPHYFSVTFGAGGSTKEKTFETVVKLQQQTGIAVAPHLSCMAASKAGLQQLLQDYQQHNIKRIVALRGDQPSGVGRWDAGDFNHANELVRFIREQTGDYFTIDVAAYPEVHPEAPSAQRDLLFFKQKVDAGANSAITQYFYNPDAYFNFIERCQCVGINIPIIAGIMPISNYAQLARFSQACGAEIPRWLQRRLADFAEDDKACLQDFGVEFVSQMCRRLLDGGAAGLHFYTLNNAHLTLRIINNLRKET